MTPYTITFTDEQKKYILDVASARLNNGRKNNYHSKTTNQDSVEWHAHGFSAELAFSIYSGLKPTTTIEDGIEIWHKGDFPYSIEIKSNHSGEDLICNADQLKSEFIYVLVYTHGHPNEAKIVGVASGDKILKSGEVKRHKTNGHSIYVLKPGLLSPPSDLMNWLEKKYLAKSTIDTAITNLKNSGILDSMKMDGVRNVSFPEFVGGLVAKNDTITLSRLTRLYGEQKIQETIRQWEEMLKERHQRYSGRDKAVADKD